MEYNIASQNNRAKYIRLLALVVLVLSIALGTSIFSTEAKRLPPQVENGVLDLSDWDFSTDGTVYINGDWAFYWQEFPSDSNNLSAYERSPSYVPVPDVWNSYRINGEKLPGDGYATYHVTIHLPKKQERMALKILSMSTAYTIIANGEVVATNGIVATSAQESQGALRPQVVELPEASGVYDLYVHVSNYVYDRGGLWYALQFGDYDTIQQKRAIGLGQDLFLAGSLLVLGLYHVVLYVLRRMNPSDLYFGVGSIIVSLRTVFTGEIFIINVFPNLTIQQSVFVEYLTYYWGMFFFTLVIKEFYPQDAPKFFIKLHFGLTTVFTAIVVLFPLKIYTATINGYHAVVVLSCLYALVVIVRAVMRRRVGALIHLAVVTFFVLAVLHDMLYNAAVIRFIPIQLVPLALFLFVFSQSSISALRYSQAYKTIHDMSEQLMSLDRMKDEFLARTSHELKTPLHGILNISQLMLEESRDTQNEDQQKRLGLIVSTTRRLSHLINDLLDSTQLKYMDTTLHRQSIAVEIAIQASIDMFRYVIEDKPIRIKCNLAVDIPHVWADENRVMQILSNLIENAIKFTERGTIVVSAHTSDDVLVVSVSDTGVGIPADKLGRIFEPFVQVDGVYSIEHDGVGLGLNISKMLVELHGGEIWAESQLGVGSTFSFTLPIYAEEHDRTIVSEARDDERGPVPSVAPTELVPSPANAAETDAVQAVAERFTILAVDDEQTNLVVLENALADEGVQLLTASNGHAALQVLADRQAIDLVILDVMMPGMSGLEVCRRIRENHTLTELPILLVTARNRQTDIEVGFAVGANDYLTKPFELAELRARVGTLLELKGSVRRLMQAQMDFLQAQIKPHFLYNTLNTIVAFCRYDGDRAAELLIQLSTYLRGSFDLHSTEAFVPFKRELELVQAYLAIEQARYGDKLHVVYEIDVVQEYRIPPLLLQPVVENAVRHGLAQKQAGGTVTIVAAEVEDALVIRVVDDGVGISAERLKELRERPAERIGIGIGNINRRLLAHYGTTLFIDSTVNIGTTVTIVIPKDREV